MTSKKKIGHLFYTTLSFVHHFKAIAEFKLELQSGNAQFGSKSAIFFCPLWPWNLMDDLENNRAPLLYYIKLCASFQSHRWIQTGVIVRKRSIQVKIVDVFEPYDLEIWRMTLKRNRAPLPSNIKLCTSFHHHMWIKTGVTVRKRLSWVLASVILTFVLWPLTLTFGMDLLHGRLSMVITPENFRMIRRQEHCQQDRRWNTDQP